MMLKSPYSRWSTPFSKLYCFLNVTVTVTLLFGMVK